MNVTTARMHLKATDTLAAINALVKSLDNPVHRHMLEVARDHWWGEVTWEIPAIMATLTPTAQILYRLQGGTFLGVDGQRVESREVVQTMYENMRDAGVTIGGMDDLTWSFGSTGITQECILWAVFPGDLLPGIAEQVDPAKLYLVSWYQATYNPFDADNRFMTGEVIYAANQPLTIEQVSKETAKQITGI